MVSVQEIFEDLIAVIYPNLCFGCGFPMVKGEELICTNCKSDLPETNLHLQKDNFIEKQFWGRVEVERATSYLYFSTNSKVQNLIHELKYRGRKEVGYKLGQLTGLKIKDTPGFSNIKAIIPVPLHKQKERKRGYNQSTVFARGIANIMDVPVYNNVLYRKLFTDTQTQKSRIERWQNVDRVFEVKNEDLIRNKNILLVDDVITTGSTLEACVIALKKALDVKVSIATIACASAF